MLSAGRAIKAAIALALTIPCFAFLQSEDFKISTNVNLVLLDVGVKDSKGGYVTDLSKDNFHIEENGISQKITTFSNLDVPVEAGLILDDSGSMRGKRAEVSAAGLAFVDASNPKDQLFVLDFNDKVRWGLPAGVAFSDDVALLRRALSLNPAAGKTVLYDAIAAGLKHLETGQRDKKTLVIVSDGGDNASRIRQPEALELIEKSQATIYTVGIFDADDEDRNPALLRRIANISGGECFLLNRIEDIVPVCKRIAQDIRKRYTIGYIPERGKGRQELRKLRVTATAPNRGKLVVRTRTTYLDPAVN